MSFFSPLHSPRLNESGFTLLELLIVVAILASIAFSTISLTNNADEQFRYEDTRTRLQNIRRAVVGNLDAALSREKLMSGYVVDNGGLPANIKALAEKPVAGFENFGAKEPLFDREPDPSTGYEDGPPTIDLNEANEILFKGHRGDYLTVPPGDGRYRDGWGMVDSSTTEDAVNFGWLVAPPATILWTTSLGSDGIADGMGGGTLDFEKDMADIVSQDDWTHDINGWQVRITNATGSDIDFGDANTVLRVSILVYVSDVSGTRRWRRLTTHSVQGLDGDGDSICQQGACLNSEVLNFLDPPLTPTLVPIGQHVLVLVEDGDGTSHNTDDKPLRIGPSGGHRVTQKVNFFPHAILPTVEIVIK